MTREEAIKAIKAWDFLNNDEKEVIETLIPELKESEDEKIRKALLEYFSHYGSTHCQSVQVADILTWIEKQGEQKPAWSEDDEIGLSDALWAIKQARTIAKDENDMGNLWYAERWLKSLKQRYAWKPSDEQMEAMQKALVDLCGKDEHNIITGLYYDLKKLKEG